MTQVLAAAPGAPISARLARVAFLRGRTADALTLAGQAVDQSAAAGESGPSASWYSYLAGTLSVSAGDPTGALIWFDKAVGSGRRAISRWPGAVVRWPDWAATMRQSALTRPRSPWRRSRMR